MVSYKEFRSDYESKEVDGEIWKLTLRLLYLFRALRYIELNENRFAFEGIEKALAKHNYDMSSEIEVHIVKGCCTLKPWRFELR